MVPGNKPIDSVFLFYFSPPGFWFQLFQKVILLWGCFTTDWSSNAGPVVVREFGHQGVAVSDD
jgi:hypothetical protein